VVSAYWPIRSEVDPGGLLARLRHAGIVVALPIILDRRELQFREWRADADLVPAGFGTSEPPADAAVVEPDVVLMPLAGFDRQRHRLGYGKGHYDKAIARLRAGGFAPQLIGLAFSVQEVPAIPFETHDIRLDAIVTERDTV
jgi:5-formyltetrahydrofolate cyclo-ligase